MAARYQQIDTEDGRLPEGIERIGYDADDQVYTYQDEQGCYYQGEPGARYGRLHTTGTQGLRNHDQVATSANIAQHKAEDWRYMAPFFLIVVVILIGVWRLFGPTIIFKCDEGLQPYRIVSGDTCWTVAKSRETTVEELTRINRGLSCDALKPGMKICTP